MGVKGSELRGKYDGGGSGARCPRCVQDRGTLSGGGLSICLDAPAGIPLHHPQKPLSAPTRKEKEDRENRCEGIQDGEARTACELCRPLEVRQTAQRGADTTTSVCRLRGYLPKVVRRVRTHPFILAG